MSRIEIDRSAPLSSTAIRSESGDHRKAETSLEGSDTWRFDSPSESISHNAPAPFRSEINAINFLFGDHIGARSSPSEAVSRTDSPLPESILYTSIFPPASALKTTSSESDSESPIPHPENSNAITRNIAPEIETKRRFKTKSDSRENVIAGTYRHKLVQLSQPEPQTRSNKT